MADIAHLWWKMDGQ